MKSTITLKYQTTVPKDVRENLGIEVHDALEWRIEKGRAVVIPIHKNFLQYRNTLKTGATGENRRGF